MRGVLQLAHYSRKARDWLVRRVNGQWLIVALGLLLVVVALWAPFGFRATPHGNGWAQMLRLESGQIVVDNSLFAARPLARLSWAAGRFLAPHSFVGAQLVLAAVFWGRGLVWYSMLRRLVPEHAAFAFAAAILLVIYPADSGLFRLDAMPKQTAVFFYLLAVYLLVFYWQQGSLSSLIGMWAALIITILMSEITYPLAFFTPLLLIWLDGRLSTRVVRMAAIWYVVPVLGLLRLGASIFLVLQFRLFPRRFRRNSRLINPHLVDSPPTLA